MLPAVGYLIVRIFGCLMWTFGLVGWVWWVGFGGVGLAVCLRFW